MSIQILVESVLILYDDNDVCSSVVRVIAALFPRARWSLPVLLRTLVCAGLKKKSETNTHCLPHTARRAHPPPPTYLLVVFYTHTIPSFTPTHTPTTLPPPLQPV